MKIGDVIRVRSVKSIFTDGRSSATFTPDRKKRDKQDVFVLLLLGCEPKMVTDETALNPEDMLNRMGWVKDEAAAEKAWRAREDAESSG